jgi:hypothetical protein
VFLFADSLLVLPSHRSSGRISMLIRKVVHFEMSMPMMIALRL